MGFVYCMECGSKISSRATFCPVCGSPCDPTTVSYLPQQSGLIRLETSSSTDIGEFLPLSPIQRENVHRIFGTAENLRRVAPAVYQLLEAQIGHKELVADITPEIQKMLASGDYQIQMKKTGELLAQIIRKTDRKPIAKQITLVEKSFAPELAPALNNLHMQMQMMQVMDQLRSIEDSVLQIAEGLHDDRLAQFESAWEQYRQALEIEDSSLRNQKLLLIQTQANEAKHRLMKELITQKHYFDEKRTESRTESLIKSLQSNSHKEIEAMNILRTDLLAVCQATRLEAYIYLNYGEQNAARACLMELGSFFRKESLDDQDVIDHLNSCDHNLDNAIPELMKEINRHLLSLPEIHEPTPIAPTVIYLNEGKENGDERKSLH